ncbi:hypothetical protein VXQ18_01070 [Brucella abortus]|nr:hypothetical protein [Brucella abortus]
MDKNARKIAVLERGILPIYEPGPDELVERNCAEGRLRFTCNLAEAVRGAEMVFIAVLARRRALATATRTCPLSIWRHVNWLR